MEQEVHIRNTEKPAHRWVNLRITIVAFGYLYLFAYTAHAKLVDHESFAATLGKSPLIGPDYAEFLAWAIPITEAMLALLLAIPPMMKKALWASMSLMVVFTSYLIMMVASGLPRTCNCGGVIESLTWPQHILFNLTVIALVPVTLYWEPIKRFFKTRLFNNSYHNMLRSIVLGLALGAIAVGNSAYTQKAEKEVLQGEIYVNTSASPGQYQMLTDNYDDINCQESSGLICAYERTDVDPANNLPESFTEEQAEQFIADGLLEPHSTKEGIYTP